MADHLRQSNPYPGTTTRLPLCLSWRPLTLPCLFDFRGVQSVYHSFFQGLRVFFLLSGRIATITCFFTFRVYCHCNVFIFYFRGVLPLYRVYFIFRAYCHYNVCVSELRLSCNPPSIGDRSFCYGLCIERKSIWNKKVSGLKQMVAVFVQNTKCGWSFSLTTNQF